MKQIKKTMRVLSIKEKQICREAYSKPCQASKMDSVAKIDIDWKPLIVFAKHSIMDAWPGSEHAFDYYLLWSFVEC